MPTFYYKDRRTIPFGDTTFRDYSASPTDPKRRTYPF